MSWLSRKCCAIASGAQNALAKAGIQLVGGVSGEADAAAVQAFLAGTLERQENPVCNHHVCGEDKHGCAETGGSL